MTNENAPDRVWVFLSEGTHPVSVELNEDECAGLSHVDDVIVEYVKASELEVDRSNSLRKGLSESFRLINQLTIHGGVVQAERDAAQAELVRLREALREIRECMGGDNPGEQGWVAPDDVWGLADEALTPQPEKKDE